MPGWDIHVRVARLLGLDPVTAREVNMDVDAGPLHDIGRRLPRIGLGGWSIHKELIREKQLSHLRNIVSKIERNPAYRDAFILHHVIDVLADLEISSRLLMQQGIVVDRSIIRDRVRFELLGLGRLVDEAHIERVIEKVFNHIDDIEKLIGPWISEILRERAAYAQLDDRAYVENVLRGLASRYGRWIDGLTRGLIRALLEMHDAGIVKIKFHHSEVQNESRSSGEVKPDCDYLTGNLFYKLHRRALLASLYFDVLYVCFKFDTYIFNKIVLRVTKRRSAQLGREAIRACIESVDPHCALSYALSVFRHYSLDACMRYEDQARMLAARYSERLHAMLSHATRLLRERYGCEVYY